MHFGLLGVSFARSRMGKVGDGFRRSTLFLTAWGFWAAPKSKHRIKGWKLWAYKAMAFGLVTLALGAACKIKSALVFAGVVLINLILLWFWKRFEPTVLNEINKAQTKN